MSRKPGPESHDPLSRLHPARTPGTLGVRDAADPNVDAHLGDTPGSLGVRDGAIHHASGMSGIPARMLKSMILGAVPDDNTGKTGLFVYHIATAGVAESTTICPEPKKGPWRKAVLIEDVKDLVAVTGAAGFKVSRLDILVHGDVGGRLWVGDDDLNPGTLDDYKPDLAKLTPYLTADAIIVLYGCVSGLGQDGSVLLKELSKILPGHKVVGFNVINTLNPTSVRREGGGWLGLGAHVCSDPEIWATDSTTSLSLKAGGKAFVNAATPEAPQAKIALNGAIVKWPSDESAKVDDATKEQVLKKWKPRSTQTSDAGTAKQESQQKHSK